MNKFRALKDDASGDRDQNEEKSAEKDGEKETSEWDESQSGSKRKAVVPGPESIPCSTTTLSGTRENLGPLHPLREL